MFLIEPEPTPYDLRFRLFGTPVRVHPMFWVMGLVLSWPNLAAEERHLTIPLALVGIGCFFVSILVHEMGHIIAGRVFGADGHVILYSFGGLAVGSNRLDRRWQRVIVSFAGPFAGFILAGVVWLVVRSTRSYWSVPLDEPRTQHVLFFAAVGILLYINLFWGILNLMPIWPLDGGMIARELFQQINPRGGLRASLIVSIIVAGVITANAIITHSTGRPIVPYVGPWLPSGLFGIFLFGSLAYSSFVALQAHHRERSWMDDHWER